MVPFNKRNRGIALHIQPVPSVHYSFALRVEVFSVQRVGGPVAVHVAVKGFRETAVSRVKRKLVLNRNQEASIGSRFILFPVFLGPLFGFRVRRQVSFTDHPRNISSRFEPVGDGGYSQRERKGFILIESKALLILARDQPGS